MALQIDNVEFVSLLGHFLNTILVLSYFIVYLHIITVEQRDYEEIEEKC
jgi:hypothetical protein